jgi:hypothetical protein
MSDPAARQARRQFIKRAVAATIAAPIAATLMSAFARAADAPHVDEANPTAASLGYKHDSTQVDAAKFPQHKPDQICSGCRYFQGQAGEWGPCAIFTGKAVSAKGWCSAYAAK